MVSFEAVEKLRSASRWRLPLQTRDAEVTTRPVRETRADVLLRLRRCAQVHEFGGLEAQERGTRSGQAPVDDRDRADAAGRRDGDENADESCQQGPGDDAALVERRASVER